MPVVSPQASGAPADAPTAFPCATWRLWASHLKEVRGPTEMKYHQAEQKVEEEE